MSNSNAKKLSLVPFILMIFTSVFGFANMPRSFFLMGYSAIPWYILSGITFFIPFAFMLSEYGSAFKEEKGGIYSWMEKSVGPKYAFVGTFMWYASYVVWMVNVAQSIWIPFSYAIFGEDKTSQWVAFGLKSTQVRGVMGILWILLITFTASKGLDKIKKITSVGGSAIAFLNVFLLIGGLVVLILNKGHLAEPITGMTSFVTSPNPDYTSGISILSFLVFAIFAYGGIEVVGGLVDQTENPEVTFPKGIAIASGIITLGYSLGIFICGIFTNWKEVLSSPNVHMGNVAYVVMKNLGYQIGQSLSLSQDVSITIGTWIARFVGLSMFLALTGAFFTLSYAPLKQIIEGTPKKLWPGKMGEIEGGMPRQALKVQCIIAIVFILLISFGGEGASAFFKKLVLMTNVAMTIPNLFIAGAFPAFKKNKNIEKPFVMFKTYKGSLIATILILVTVGFANIFTIIEPAVHGDLPSTIWMIVGPIVFSVVALVMYYLYERNNK